MIQSLLASIKCLHHLYVPSIVPPNGAGYVGLSMDSKTGVPSRNQGRLLLSGNLLQVSASSSLVILACIDHYIRQNVEVLRFK